jgi:RNA polymerase II subunit A-like phosphatase
VWRRQDETSYLLEEPSTGVPIPSLDSNRIGPEIEPEPEDWGVSRDQEPVRRPSLELGEIDWNGINDEVDAAMNESDDDEDESEVKSEGNVSEEDDEANSVIRSVEERMS